MALKQDWILKQIDMLIQFVARLVFHKDTAAYKINDESNLSQTDIIHEKLLCLIKEGKFCEAEDFLFDNIDESSIDYLEMSLDFYQRLNTITDAELEQDDFSREEIEHGLRDILKKFNVPTVGL